MVTIHTFDFQPLTAELIDRGLTREGGVYILARRSGWSGLKPFQIGRSGNLRSALRKYYLNRLSRADSYGVDRESADGSEGIWVRMIAVQGEEQQRELASLLADELMPAVFPRKKTELTFHC